MEYWGYDRAFHIRKVSRCFLISRGTARVALEYLGAKQALRSIARGRMRLFSLPQSSRICRVPPGGSVFERQEIVNQLVWCDWIGGSIFFTIPKLLFLVHRWNNHGCERTGAPYP